MYGPLENDGEYFYETTPYDPHSPYSASKASSDMLVKLIWTLTNSLQTLQTAVTTTVLISSSEKLIPLIINNALHGKELPVYGDGKNVRDWLYVEDHAKGIDMVQEKGRLFETYNIGGHNENRIFRLSTLSWIHFGRCCRKMTEKELVSENLITYVTDRRA